MNLPVLTHAARVWVEVFDYEAAGSPRTLPLPSLAKEVLALEVKRKQCLIGCHGLPTRYYVSARPTAMAVALERIQELVPGCP